MSEMVRHKGIIKKLSTPENLMEVFDKLVKEGKINRNNADIYDGKVHWIDEDEYDIINGCIFDMSDAPQEYDADQEVEEAEKLNDTDYRIHIYYYNGSDSPLEDAIVEADKEYEKTSKTVYYAVKRKNGYFWFRAGSPTPALFLTPGKARSTVEQYAPAYADEGYDVVKFMEVE